MWSLAAMFVFVIELALSIAWLVRVAESRGRSQLLWGFAGGAICISGFLGSVFLVALLPMRLDGRDGGIGPVMLEMFAPFLIALFAVFAFGVALQRLPVKVVAARRWAVHCRKNGAGQLEIAPDALHLEWASGHKQDLARSLLHTIEADGECLRLGWADGDLLLIPMMNPQTRDGRIRQSQTLAKLLSPGLPQAIRVDRKHSA